jgi:hypothetical protein
VDQPDAPRCLSPPTFELGRYCFGQRPIHALSSSMPRCQ